MKLRSKIILSNVLVTLFSVILAVSAIIITIAAIGESNARKQLIADTEFLTKILQNEGIDALKNIDDFGLMRVTVVDEQGKVMYDSDFSGEMVDHANREEIIKALSGKSQIVSRYSETLKCNMLYYAVIVKNTPPRVLLRVAVRTSDVTGVAIIALAVSFFTLAAALIVTIIIGNSLSKRVLKRVGDIKDSLKSINNGNYVPIETHATEPEFFGVLNETNEIFVKTDEAFKKITAERKKTEFVLNSISQGVVALNDKSEVILLNSAAKALLIADDSVLNKNLMYLIKDNELRGNILKNIKGELAADSSLTLNGRDLEISVKVPAKGESGKVKAIIVINDISESKMLMKQKSEFFQNASHELKTPLTSVQGLTELLLSKEDISDESKKYLTRIYKESTRLSSLILDMLKLSSLESQQGKTVVLSDCSLLDVCRETALSLEKKQIEKKINLSITGDATVRFDYKKLREIVENLYSNALNYNTINGKVTIEITNGENPSLKITDTGEGIEKENIPRLCERFFREDKSRSKQTGGTGLGLAIVKHICALYNAKLKIESEKNVGTTVTVIFDGKSKKEQQ